jgi:D-proline reductase (dithiol) PrdB
MTTSPDDAVRAGVASMPVWTPDVIATDAPPLRDATVAIVTTAGLRHDGVHVWQSGDESFVRLDGNRRDLSLTHASPNFDRTGFATDLNVVYPIDRLHELAADGVIGRVSDVHLSFMGAQGDHTLSTIRLDTGPQAATVLREAGVDVVLLTPV